MKDVHTEHCCKIHGCKYGDSGCSVVKFGHKQSFPCEYCEPEEKVKNQMNNEENDSLEDSDEISDENKDFSELLEEYKDQEKMWHFEGNSGLEKLNKLCGAIGYESHGFKFGSNLEVFLSDNPGACEALLEWIEEAGNSAENWKEELISNLNEKKDLEDEDSDED